MSGESQKHAISHLIVGRNKTTSRCQTPGPQHNMPFTVTKNKQTNKLNTPIVSKTQWKVKQKRGKLSVYKSSYEIMKHR